MTDVSPHQLEREAYRDVISYMRCALRGDSEGKAAIIRHCTPALMLDTWGTLYLGWATAVTGLEPEQFLDFLAANFPTELPEQGR